jgi:hypothetical protein
MSAHLTWGEIHPRTLLAGLGESKAHDTFRKEIAWREFYADVLHNYPHTDKDYYAPQFANMSYDEPVEKFKEPFMSQIFCRTKIEIRIKFVDNRLVSNYSKKSN